jgi:hypothetical protein
MSIQADSQHENDLKDAICYMFEFTFIFLSHKLQDP